MIRNYSMLFAQESFLFLRDHVGTTSSAEDQIHLNHVQGKCYCYCTIAPDHKRCFS